VQVGIVVVERSRQRSTDFFWAGRPLHDVLVGATLHEGHWVLAHGEPASLHAEPKRTAQDRVDVAEGAPRRVRMLLDHGAGTPLALPPADDPGGTASRGAGGVGGAAAFLGHGLDLGAAAMALADGDQLLDGHLGEVAVLGELVIPVRDLARQYLRG
jgi:hypothetical protein